MAPTPLRRSFKDKTYQIWSLTVLFLMLAPRMVADLNPHQPMKLTWQVQSQTGDVVWSVSREAPPNTWWPDLTLDLCLLIAGLDTWDIPERSHKELPILSETTHYQRTAALGCARPWSRCQLRLAPFYVCPGDGRSRSEAHRCGGLESSYCAAWGCETSGSVYWNPSSSWDLITVSRNHSGTTTCPQRGRYLPSSQSTCNHNSQCNPIVIKFTEEGKKYLEWVTGRQWGLRFYVKGTDPGLTFSIRLKIENP